MSPTQPQALEPMHADLMRLHGQIQECEAEGLNALADALRNILQRQMRERGIEPVRVPAPAQTQDDRPPMSGAAKDLFAMFAPKPSDKIA